MDRSLNDATQRIADQLVSLSYEYESGVESRSTPPTFDVLEELALLRMLEPLARKSLPETAQGNPASDVKSAAKKTSPKTAEVQYTSSRPEYRQALDNPSLVNALIQWKNPPVIREQAGDGNSTEVRYEIAAFQSRQRRPAMTSPILRPTGPSPRPKK